MSSPSVHLPGLVGVAERFISVNVSESFTFLHLKTHKVLCWRTEALVRES